MRTLIPWLAFAAVACGGTTDSDLDTPAPEPEVLTVEEFLAQYAKNYRRAAKDCPGAAEYDPDAWGEQCQFDEEAAQDCLDGAFQCEVESGVNVLYAPDDCRYVFSYCTTS